MSPLLRLLGGLVALFLPLLAVPTLAQPEGASFMLYVKASATQRTSEGSTSTTPAGDLVQFYYSEKGRFFISDRSELYTKRKAGGTTFGNGGSGCYVHREHAILKFCYSIRRTGNSFVVTVQNKSVDSVTDITTIGMTVEGNKCRITSYSRKYEWRAGTSWRRYDKPRVEEKTCLLTRERPG